MYRKEEEASIMAKVDDNDADSPQLLSIFAQK